MPALCSSSGQWLSIKRKARLLCRLVVCQQLQIWDFAFLVRLLAPASFGESENGMALCIAPSSVLLVQGFAWTGASQDSQVCLKIRSNRCRGMRALQLRRETFKRAWHHHSCTASRFRNSIMASCLPCESWALYAQPSAFPPTQKVEALREPRRQSSRGLALP